MYSLCISLILAIKQILNSDIEHADKLMGGSEIDFKYLFFEIKYSENFLLIDIPFINTLFFIIKANEILLKTNSSQIIICLKRKIFV